MMKGLRFLTTLTMLATFSSLVSAEHHESKSTIVDVAKEAGSFNTLLAALDAAKLTATLEGEGPFTVFAPTDAAFAALPAGVLDGLLADPAALSKVLTYHVVAGRAASGDIVGKSTLQSLEGKPLTVSTEGGVKVGGANVTSADVDASNGVIHVIDQVLIP
jgi:uncharacterized surface protein with fasciclin (FAS1) repeats